MIPAWIEALEESVLASALRNSVWAYPLVNAGHIIGVALLVGGSVPLSLRLLGFWRSVPVASLRRILTKTAATGLVLAVMFGILLFVTRASEYAASPIFVAKMLALLAGIVVSSAVHALSGKNSGAGDHETGKASAIERIAAGLALAVWPAVLVLGRLIGYF